MVEDKDSQDVELLRERVEKLEHEKKDTAKSFLGYSIGLIAGTAIVAFLANLLG